VSFTASLEEIVQQNASGLLGNHPTWSRVSLSDVAIVMNGFPFSSDKFNNTHGTPLIRIRDVTRGSTNTFFDGDYDPAYLVANDELLIGMDGDFNCSHWRGGPGLLNQRVCRVMPDERFYDQRFLAFVLPSYLAAINRATSSITVKHLSSFTISTIPLPLPPLPEQHRIVAEIERQFSLLDAGVAGLRRVQVNLRRYRASVLQDACAGRLVPTEAEQARAEGRDYEPAETLLARILSERRARWEAEQLAKMEARGTLPKDDAWKAKYVEPSGPNTAGLPKLPEGWVWCSAEQICGFITKGTTPASNKMQAGVGDVPYIKVYNMTHEGRLDFSINPTFISRKVHEDELTRSKVIPGDVLMNIVGPPLGKVSIVPETFAEWNINQAIAIFRPLPGMDRSFLAFSLLTENILSRITSKAKATAGQYNLTLELSRMLPLPLPPLAEQERIIAEVERRLSVVEQLERVIAVNLKRAERLRQSILKEAFAGRLVPQDPNDEPAWALLERIRAERAAASAALTPAARRRPSPKSRRG
jgi:type I restriction enzyme S subunit